MSSPPNIDTADTMKTSGPLAGIRVLEFVGIGPGPFAAMLLSDLGAEVLRIDRLGSSGAAVTEVVSRGRTSLAIDLKRAEGVAAALALIEKADVLIEGFRPGVMERLGLGPEIALARQPKLIYGRVTGWGQSGPLAEAAGHDINYIALTGALAVLGPPDRPPPPPLNLVGDYGGGSLYLALGIVSALLESRRSGRGQIVDAAIVDGAASLMALGSWMNAAGMSVERGTNPLDGAAHYYRCYECADGRHIAIGSLEPHFYKLLLERAGADATQLRSQDPSSWQENAKQLDALFRRKSRDEWCSLLEGTDACFAPVLTLQEAPHHHHMKAREVFVERFGVVQPAPAPRFSRTPGDIQGAPPAAGEGGRQTALSWGIPESQLP